MKHECMKCGSRRITFLVTQGDVQCRNEGCGHRGPMVAQGTNRNPEVIPAGVACHFVNQCETALHGNCIRTEMMHADFSCVFARLQHDMNREAA